MSELTRASLIENLHAAGKPADRWRVGAEFERHLLRADGSPLPYFGEPGVRWLLEQLPQHGYRLEHEGEHPIAAWLGSASITLEPGSQWELSGSPFVDLSPIYDEARALADLTDHLLAGTGVHQVALGYTPFTPIDEVPWVPKGRYVVMREYLKQTGELAHGMMKGTCAVQATYDFSDEEDASRKVRLATAMGPLTTAMFANSPYLEGRPSGFVSFRGHIWTKTDPARAGMPDAAVEFSFERWVDYLLQVPMMFKKVDGRWTPAHGQTFAAWMLTDQPPTAKDWELHMTSVFPEVRVKNTIEVRGADCVPLPLAMAFAALFKGLFYCEASLAAATEVTERFTRTGTRGERFDVACRDGLRGVSGGRTLAEWSRELVSLADEGLARTAPHDRHWLRPLIDQVERGESPGHALLRTLGDRPDPTALLEATHIVG